VKEAGFLYSVLWQCVVGGPGRALWHSVWSRRVSSCRYFGKGIGRWWFLFYLFIFL